MLSIVIPVYHKQTPDQEIYELWQQLLTSLCKQNTSWQLVVVEIRLQSEPSPLFSYIQEYWNKNKPHSSVPSSPVCSCHLEVLHLQKESQICRSVAINKAIEISQGTQILVLHEDMILPEGALREINSVLSTFEAGGFCKKYLLNEASLCLCFLENWLNQIRSRQGKHLVGSNAMYFTKRLWEKHHFQGNFMEDVEFSDWQRHYLKKQVHISPLKVQVSARRYQSMKIWRAILMNACILFLYRYSKMDLQTLEQKLQELYKISPKISHCRFFHVLWKSISKNL